MAIELVVKHEFLDYKIGDHITDQVKIQEILSGEQQHFVVKKLSTPAAQELENLSTDIPEGK